MKKQYKYLLSNSLLFAIGNFAPKILSFILVPLYTARLTTNEYGIADIITSTAFIIIPILLCEIAESALRFAFDEEVDNTALISTIFFFYLKRIAFLLFIAAAVCAGSAYIGYYSYIKYITFIFLTVITNGVYFIFLNYLRGIEKIKEVVILSILSTILNCFFNILFLVVYNAGLEGYVFSSVLSIFIASIFIFIKNKLYKLIQIKRIDNKLKQQLLLYSKPLILNKLSWDILTYSDKYTITILISASANGVYSIASKIPTILGTLSNVFSDAWRLSAIKEFDKDDKNGFISQIYNAYTTLLVWGCSLILIFNIPLARILYSSNGFFEAWKYVPFLLISVLLSGLSSFLASIYMSVKETKIIQSSTIVCSIVNIILNVVLVMIVGPIGAAISTVISGYVRWIYRHIKLKNYIKCRFEYVKFHFELLLLLIQTILYLIAYNAITISISFIILSILIVLNRNYISFILKKMICRG
ncbi:MAG: polysaccharide biosynthesis C-terminal domain-containing protein [Ruminococcus sp.]|nr:polysaccharide biosynthesis C-terminal domain-containing protein [Ruminococcus sp.]